MHIVICSTSSGESDRLGRLIDSLDDLNLIGRTDSADAFVDFIRNEHVDVGLVTGEALDIGLAARRRAMSSQLESTVWVARLERESLVQTVKAAQYGFSDVITGPMDADSFGRDLSDIVARRRSVVTNPVLSDVDVVPGLYARTIDFRDDLDRDLCELLGLGIEDRDAAFVLRTNVQEIRNRIAALLERNGLSSRTQLATLYIRSRTSLRDGG